MNKDKILKQCLKYHFNSGMNCAELDNIGVTSFECEDCPFYSFNTCPSCIELAKSDDFINFLSKIITDNCDEDVVIDYYKENINNKENIMITKIKEQFEKVKKMPMLKQALITAGTIFAVIAIIDNYSNIKTGIKDAIDKALSNEGVKELQKDLSKVVEPFTKTVTDVIANSNNKD